MIMNDFHDLEYAQRFALDNKNIKNIINDNRFFLNIGHCYSMMWSSTIHMLSTIVDKEYSFLSKTDNWIKNFKD